MKNKILLVICLIIFIVSIAGISAAEINQTDDTNGADTLSVSLSDGEIAAVDNGTFTDLQKKINDANESSTIVLENDYAYDSGFSTNGITINKNLTIEGNGHVIDALGQSRIFYITSTSVTLNNITFKNGHVSSDHGGAIYFNNIVSDCSISGVFINNSASNDGGAIYLKEIVSNFTVSGEFINNSANWGGAVYFFKSISDCSVSGRFINNNVVNRGGAIQFGNTVSNCSVSGEFAGNTATYGGAISFSNTVSNYIISAGEFINNSAKSGGAVYFSGSVSDCSVSGEFINNSASDECGAVYFYQSVSNCNISGEFINNTALRCGALRFCNSVSNCNISGRFINNTAKNVNGGVIDFGSTVSNCGISGDFIGNSASNDGGAILLSNVVSNCSISGRFINNSANSGGALRFGNAVYNCSVSGEFIGNTAKYGGAVYFYGSVSNSTISNSVVVNSVYNPKNLVSVNTWFGNNASNYESKPYLNCESWLFLDASSTLVTVEGKSTVVFTLDNLYNSSSGKVTHPDISSLPDVVLELSASNGYLNKYSVHPGESIIFTSSGTEWGVVTAKYGGFSYSILIGGNTFTDLQKKINYADENSTIVLENDYIYDSGFSSDGIKINKNLTIEGNGHVIDALGQSRIFYITSTSVNLNNITFKNGYTTGRGGAIYFNNIVSNCSIFGEFINNSAKSGGAIYFNNIVSDFSVSGDFINNSASDECGAVYFSQSVSNCNISGEFINNTALRCGALRFPTSVSNCNISGRFINNSAKNVNGGVIDFGSTVSNCNISGDFIGNYAGDSGGSILLNGVVSNCSISGRFINNSANYGGALRFGNNIYNSSVSGEFTGNTAKNNGGAISVAGTISNCTISGRFINNAVLSSSNYDGGGAIYVSGSVSDCNVSGEFINNSANYGGAIRFNNVVSNSRVFGDFINNTARTNGGAVYFYQGVSDSIISAQFINNSALNSGGGAIRFNNVVSNSSIFGEFINNSALNAGGIEFGSTVTNCNIYCRFINNTARNNGGAIYWDSVSNCNVSGEFINNSANNGGGINFVSSITNCDISGRFINNTARNNGGALFFSSSVTNSTISNSVVVNSVYNPKNLVSVNTWFGNNASNYESKPYPNCESWLFLDASSVPITGVNGKSSVTFTLDNLYNSSSKVITHPDVSDLPDVVFELSAVNGYLNKYYVRPGESVIFTSTVNKDGIVTAKCCDASYSIKIVNLKVDAPDVNKYYNGSEEFVVTLTNNAHNPVSGVNVSVTIGGKTYSGPSDSNGIFSAPLDLNPGNYTVTTTASGIKVLSTVIIYSTIESSDVNAIYKNVTFEATILDSTGMPVSNREIEFSINSLKLNNTTDENGHVSIGIDLDVDNYIITTTNPVTGETKTNKVVISKAASSVSISCEALSDSATLTAEVIGPGVISGDVIFVINGNSYYNEDLNNSKASITLINMDSGSYTAKVTYNGDANHNSSASEVITFYVGEYNYVISAPDVVKDYQGPERFNITLTNNNVPVGGASVKISINGKNYTEITDNNGKISMDINDLNADVYGVVVSYGDVTVNSAIIVNQLNTKTNLSLIRNGDKDVTLTAVIDSSYASGEVVFTVNGEDYTRNVTDSNAVLTLSDLDYNNYTVKAVYKGDINHKSSSSNMLSFVVKAKENLTIEAFAEPITVGEDAVVVVTGFEGATGNVTVKVGDGIYTAPIIDGNAAVTVSGLTENSTAFVSYPGDDNYNNASASVNIVVNPNYKKNLTLVAESVYITYGDDAMVLVSGFEGATGIATAKVGNGIYNSEIISGEACFIVPGIVSNTTAYITYSGDDNYNNASVTADIFVNRQNATMEIGVDKYEVNVGQKVNVTVNLSVDATGEVMIGTEVVPLVNGAASAKVPCLVEGNLTIPVVYYGDEKYNPLLGDVIVTVNYVPRENATMNVAADEVSVGENTTVVVTLPEDATGEVIVGGEVVPVVNGSATASIPALVAGKFTLDVVYSGDEKYNSIVDSVNITIKGADIIIAPDVVKYYHGSERFVVNVTDFEGNPLANKTVIININGVTYTRTTNEQGSASMALGLGAGVYNVTVTVDNNTVNSTVTILTTVNGTDVVKIFRNGTQYYATFRDSKGNYLADGTTVRFNINGVFYDRQVSGDKGLARLNLNLVQGEYILTAINLETGEQSGNIITVIPKIVENRNVTKYFRNATQYSVKILDDAGNPVGAGKEVTFNINGVLYKRSTNESGIAKMNINLNPGVYVITAEYGGCVVSNTITILPTLTASDLNKKFGTPDPFVATAVDGQGNPLVNQTVTFNINGVLYKRVTNATGQARLNINLVHGEYIITSMCNDAVISNKVTITP